LATHNWWQIKIIYMNIESLNALNSVPKSAST